MSLGSLVVKLGLDTTEFEEKLMGVNSLAKSTAAGIKQEWEQVGNAALVLGAAISAALGYATVEAANEEEAMLRLANTLKNVGVNYDDVKDSLDDTIMSMESMSAVSDDDLYSAFNKLLNITGDYDESLTLLQTSLDLAKGANIDLETAARLVGNAAEGTSVSLSRYGIVVADGATSTEILAAITERYGGSAEAMGTSTNSAMQKIKLAVNNLSESIGTNLLPALKNISNFIAKIIDVIKDWTDEHPNLTSAIVLTTAALGLLLLGIAAYIKLASNATIQTVAWTVSTIAHTTATIAANVAWVAYTYVVEGATAGQIALNLAMEANPVGVVIAAVTALVAIVALLIVTYKEITNLFKSNTVSQKELAEQITTTTEAIKNENDSLTSNEESLAEAEDTLADYQESLAEAEDALSDLYAQESEATDEMNDASSKVDELTKLYDDNVDAVHDAQSEVDYWTQALDDANDALDAANDKLEIDTQSYNDLTDAISDTESAIKDLSSANLEGMGEYADEIEAVQEKINDVKLSIAEANVAGTDTTALEAQLDALNAQKDLLEAQQTAEYDNQLYDIKSKADAILGNDQELSYEDIMSQLTDAGIELSDLSAQQQAALDALNVDQAAVDTAQSDVNTATSELATAQSTLDSLNESIQAVYDSILGNSTEQSDILNSITGSIADQQDIYDTIKNETLPGLADSISTQQEAVENLITSIITQQGVVNDLGIAIQGINNEITYLEGLYDNLTGTDTYGTVSTVPGLQDALNSAASGLPGYASGGEIAEPTLLYGLKSQQVYAIAGEAGKEQVVSGTQSNSNNIKLDQTFNISAVIREESDIKKIAKELYNLSKSGLRQVGLNG